PARRIKRARSPDSASCIALDARKPRRGLAQGLLLLREAEAHQRRPGRRFRTEYRDRNRGDAVLGREPTREVGIGLGRDSPVVRKLKIRTARRRQLESRARKQLDEEVALLPVEVRQRKVVRGALSHEVRERVL